MPTEEVPVLSPIRPTSITSTRNRGAVVITISGPITAGGGDLLLRAEVAEALYSGVRRVVLDFAGLSTLDSSGLGELMRARTAVKECDGRMAWACCPTTMLDVLEITNVEFENVEFVDSVEGALAALRESADG